MPYRWTLTDLSSPYMDSEVLTSDPIGWDEGTYTIKRSEIYKGAFHEYTTSLKFHCQGGGKQFIDAAYQTWDIDGRVDVLVEYDCDGSGTYDTLFSGIINLASYKTDGEYTTCNIEKSDLLTKLFNRDEISVDLETTTSIGGSTITAPDATTITLPPIDILFENEWVTEDGYVHVINPSVQPGHAYEIWVTHDAGILKGDIDTVFPNIECVDDSSFAFFEGLLYIEPILTVRETGVNYPITVNYDISQIGVFTDHDPSVCRENQGVQLKLIYGRIDIADTNSITDAFAYNIGGYTDEFYSFNFNYTSSGTFQLNQGDSVWLVWQYDNISVGCAYQNAVTWTFDRSYLRLSSRTTYDATQAKTMLVHEAFNQVVDAIADSNNNFYSDFYGRTDSEKIDYPSDGCGSEITITNGLNIRKFSDKPIFCSFKELFNTFDCLHNIGMGVVGGVVRVEPLTYWYDGTNKIITLPLVNKYETHNDNKRYINKIDIGYQKWESEFKGGLDEPCSKHQYSTKINSAKNIYSKLSEYSASSYAIELTRRKNKDVLPTEDWRYDNDNFIICLTRDAYAGLVVETYGYSFAQGANMQALSTAYNFRITPARMLLAHMNIITAGLQLIQGAITFVSASGNFIFRVAERLIAYVDECAQQYGGYVLSENQNFNWNDSKVLNISPIWGTEIYTLEYPLTYTEFKTIKANPYGYVEFYKFVGDVKAGFILSMEYKMKTGMTKFELLKKA